MTTLASVAGIDEAGRGALAGPVVAAACMLKTLVFRRRRTLIPLWGVQKKKIENEPLIADSKSLSPEARERSYEWIIGHCVWGVGIVDAETIDSIGIVKSNHQAMIMALDMLRQSSEPKKLFVDGKDRYSFSVPHESVIRGDQIHPCVAAASIIAKVTRDRLMRKYALQFPLYGFASHKGYGSKQHIALLQRHGTCPIHRRTFVRSMLENQALALAFAD